MFSTVQLVEPFEDALSYPVISLSPVSNDSLSVPNRLSILPNFLAKFWKIRTKHALSKINIWLHGQHIQNGARGGFNCCNCLECWRNEAGQTCPDLESFRVRRKAQSLFFKLLGLKMWFSIYLFIFYFVYCLSSLPRCCCWHVCDWKHAQQVFHWAEALTCSSAANHKTCKTKRVTQKHHQKSKKLLVRADIQYLSNLSTNCSR